MGMAHAQQHAAAEVFKAALRHRNPWTGVCEAMLPEPSEVDVLRDEVKSLRREVRQLRELADAEGGHVQRKSGLWVLAGSGLTEVR